MLPPLSPRRSVPLLLALALAAPAVARAQTGNFCVRDFQPGAVCTANDVRIQALNLVSVIETCAGGVPGEAEGIFDIFVSAVGAPERYDIGLFVALDGGSARDGDVCNHDYLQPPLTPTPAFGDHNADGVPDVFNGPWFDADADQCGDINAGTQVFKRVQLRLVCVDTNGNGTVDASACTSWDNNAITNCASLADAFPGTNAKCGCDRVETGIPFVGPSPSPPPSPSPSPGPSPSPSPRPGPVPVAPPGMLMGLAVLLVAGGYLLLRRRGPAPR